MTSSDSAGEPEPVIASVMYQGSGHEVLRDPRTEKFYVRHRIPGGLSTGGLTEVETLELLAAIAKLAE